MEQSNSALGEGKLFKLMLKFSIPCVLSLFVSALYNIVDQIFIGNSELGDLGNAATGVVFPIFIIAQAFAWWFGDGCAAFLNICQGKKQADEAHRAIGTGIVFTVGASAVLMILFFPLKRSLLLMFGASENSIDLAVEYFNIVLAFFPVFMAMNMVNAVVRADGSPGWSMASMLTGAIVNIVLDAVFILALHLGMAGAAWATVIGQIVSFAVCLFYLIKKSKTFKLKLKSFIPDMKQFGNAAKLGLSSFITQMTIVIISLVCNIMLKKYGGLSQYGEDIPIAIIAIESKVFTVVINIVVGIVLGCQPIIGYNIGAQKYDRVKKLYRNILVSTVAVGLIATLIFELAPREVVGIFGAPKFSNPTLYWDFATKTFRIFLMLVTFTCTIKMTSIFFQAAGKPIRAIIASMIRDIVCFIPLICVLPIFYGIGGILWAAPIADGIAMLVAAALTLTYFIKSRKNTNNTAEFDSDEHSILSATEKGAIITISREHGSSGKQIGKIVADKLGIPFYYKDVIAIAAKESGLDREFLSDITDPATNALYSLYMSTNVVSQAIIAQDKAIKAIAERGSCVIVGRAADYVLRDNPDVVRVFIYAPEEYRIARIAEVYGDSRAEAQKHIKRADKARAAYYKAISARNWSDVHNYDLAVDGSIGVQQSAQLITDYIAHKIQAQVESQQVKNDKYKPD
ncbi:MAG: cytidylate kinase family protein [Clostridiales bacterium]|nr:cytidylate kinase family protein [Clostridiales bacterium]